MPWTNPQTPLSLQPITVAFWNANARDNLNVLRANTGSGDPTGAGQVAIASGPNVTAWGLVNTGSIADGAVTDAKMATQKVSRAGDVMTGGLQLPVSQGLNLGGGGFLLDFPSGTFIRAAHDTFVLANAANTQQILNATPTQFYWMTNPVIHSGNVGSQSVAHAATADGASGTFTLANGGQIFDTSGSTIIVPHADTLVVQNVAGTVQILNATPTQFFYLGNKVWHAGNDGNASGLDADLWRGQAPSAITVGNATTVGGFAPSNSPGGIPISAGATTTNIGLSAQFLGGRPASNAAGDVPLSNGTVCSNLNADQVDGVHASGLAQLGVASNFTVAPTIGGGTVWHSLNDGSGSSLDAGLLRGIAGSLFLQFASGSYSGNGGLATIAMGFRPLLLFCTEDAVAGGYVYYGGMIIAWQVGGATGGLAGTTTPTALTFTSSGVPLNANGHHYNWIAFG